MKAQKILVALLVLELQSLEHLLIQLRLHKLQLILLLQLQVPVLGINSQLNLKKIKDHK